MYKLIKNIILPLISKELLYLLRIWIFTNKHTNAHRALPLHTPHASIVTILHYESIDSCRQLPFSSHIPHLFGFNYAVQNSFFFLNKIPVCYVVSTGSTTLDSISDPFKANSGQSCIHFLNRLNGCQTMCIHVNMSVCACLPESVCWCTRMYDYLQWQE